MESVALGTPLVEDDLDEDDTNLGVPLVLELLNNSPTYYERHPYRVIHY